MINITKRSKRYTELAKKVVSKKYSLDSALVLLKEFNTTNFTESTELHIALNINPKQSEYQVRTSIVLPHGLGKSKKIAVLTEDDNEKEFLQQGAFLAGYTSIIETIASGKLNFDILLTTPLLMPKLAKFGKILGPKGLMPSPKSGTVVTDLALALSEFRKGKIEYKTDKMGIIHSSFGNLTFTVDQLKKNFIEFYLSILKQKPSSIKGRYIKSVNICSTMSPNLSVDLTTLKF
ncbi:MAG: 50S ribosomal protein L1 [Flavobacteriales bacterium]|nr:MAG: 50S ribosomal protein L1 [Flavobacteriales bacterium]